MDVSANFAFLKQEFPHVATGASLAERHVQGDPRAACFHARFTLERLLARVYKVDKTLEPPKATNLDGYLHEPAFVALVPEAVWQKAEYIRQAGNAAAHGKKMPTPETALGVVRELYHLLYWAGRSYLRKGAERLRGQVFDETLILTNDSQETPASVAELDALEAKLRASEAARQETEAELAAVRERLAAIKAENDAVPETRDWNEGETRQRLIDFALRRAGWTLDQKRDREFLVTGLPTPSGRGFVDYVLWGDDGKPLAVVEAKKTTVDARAGRQQAKLYADALEAEHGQRPVIFYTNGYQTHLWDDTTYPPRAVAGFHTQAELATLVHRRAHRQPLDVVQVKDAITDRYYQKRAITSIAKDFANARRKALLVMATGTGKTRTAISLVDVLQRASWIKRVLFLADRRALVKQAVNAFKAHLPESSPVNLLDEKDKLGRVYGCTYPTMMGLIDETHGGDASGQARFGVGHFDLIIIDEAHRSVYQKFSAIFDYFDSLLVGLTATPREQVDRNTYRLFDLEPGSPTDAYELDTAVNDEYLVPPRKVEVDLKFPRQGITYDDLNDEEQEQWENLDWGDEADEVGMPHHVDAAAINSWLFNIDTVDKVLQCLMERGHKVDGGDRLAKTIVFARNHNHAELIAKRFDHHYPKLAGHFARVIDNQASHVESLIDDFERPEKDPHLAISVDMLDTGIDVPAVANLVFFKPVYSKIKFWQMIGRGTRLCEHLFGPGEHKQDFRVFDVCRNFAFFEEKPDGIETGDRAPLGTRLFASRVRLLSLAQSAPALDPESRLAEALIDTLHGEVAALNRDNFIVRMHLESVNRFTMRAVWTKLSVADCDTLSSKVAGLPSMLELDDIMARRFDLKALHMQLAMAENDEGVYEVHRKRMIEIASLLEEKRAVPTVEAQLPYLAALQEHGFWEGVGLDELEDMRLRLRGLVSFLDKRSRNVVYTDFEDEILEIRESGILNLPKMTSAEYERKVQGYLRNHLDHLVIRRLRTNKPLTEGHLEELETMLVEIGEEDGKTLLTGLLERTKAPSLAHFVRSMVGLDRAASKKAFAGFINDRSLTSPQMRFVEMVIEQLTTRGVMDASALYGPPFSDVHAGGPDALFTGKENVIEGIFETLEAVHDGLDVETG